MLRYEPHVSVVMLWGQSFHRASDVLQQLASPQVTTPPPLYLFQNLDFPFPSSSAFLCGRKQEGETYDLVGKDY